MINPLPKCVNLFIPLINQQAMNNQDNRKIQITYYKIADHILRVVDRIGIDLDRALSSFVPFKIDEPEFGPNLTSIEVTDEQCDLEQTDLVLLSDISVIWEERFRLEESNDSYFTSILANDEGGTWIMKSSKDFAFSRIFIDLDEIYSTTKLSWLIMVSFGQACLHSRTLLIHASVVTTENLGFAFLGKSGTGKSTHSRLWLSHINGTELLNDDNPAIRVFPNGEVFIYGTPWSGKTRCYKNKKVPLAGIARLQQGPKNNFNWKIGSEALVTVLPSGSAIRWDSFLFSQMVSILESIINHVPVAHLECLPDREAAELSFLNFKDKRVVNSD